MYGILTDTVVLSNITFVSYKLKSIVLCGSLSFTRPQVYSAALIFLLLNRITVVQVNVQ